MLKVNPLINHHHNIDLYADRYELRGSLKRLPPGGNDYDVLPCGINTRHRSDIIIVDNG